MTTTKSPPGWCGEYVGLCLPFKIEAIWVARRPTRIPAASTRTQSFVGSFEKYVFTLVTSSWLRLRVRSGHCGEEAKRECSTPLSASPSACSRSGLVRRMRGCQVSKVGGRGAVVQGGVGAVVVVVVEVGVKLALDLVGVEAEHAAVGFVAEGALHALDERVLPGLVGAVLVE